MGPRGRADGGRLEAWKAAFEHLKENRGLVAQCAGVVLGSAVVINLPFVPGHTYVRGLATGMLVVALLWIMSWFAWVTSGLAFRIQGTFAQESVTAQMRGDKNVFAVVASLKFGGRDVDQVVITRRWRYGGRDEIAWSGVVDGSGAGRAGRRGPHNAHVYTVVAV